MSYNPSPRCCISHNWQNNSTSQIKLLTIHDRDAKGSSGIDIYSFGSEQPCYF